MTLGTIKNPVEFVEEDQLNEDLLMEGPFIEGPLDFAYINGQVEKRILGKAVTDATQAIEDAFPGISPESATQIITGKKSRTSEKTPDAVKAALEKVDNAIKAQLDTFDDEELLKDLINKGEIGKNDEKALERINSYIEPDEEGNIKRYVEKLGGPQTLNAVGKILSGETSTDVEPETKETPKAAKTTEPKKATLTKGDDGFDNVSYSEPKAAKPKTADADKASTMASKTPKLDKLAGNQDALLKAQRDVKDKMQALAQQLPDAKEDKRNEIVDELKKLNQLNGELQKKIDKLF
jgi:chemotaxis protein histidine kinase CheA